MLFVFQYLKFHAWIIHFVHAKAVIEDVRRVDLGVIVECFCKIRLPAPRLSPIVAFEFNDNKELETLKMQKHNSGIKE